jgi:hypothetical protein
VPPKYICIYVHVYNFKVEISITTILNRIKYPLA